ncbi:hypothetical protein ALC56_03316 [Trachymyrmex septentrionalis]|uniref:Uncharacterized protein n=1 Tax=Trachymyrmex septentrionalis TaxID=34720 RepID=A0A195FNZ8_9HYME|nr:hypothetical protein ALC56_03316 [Trachymyrmex septentrionalis]
MVRMLHAHRCILDFEDTPMPSTNVQGVHLLNDQLSVSQRIIVRSNGKERCTAVLVIALPTLRASVRVRHRRTDIDATHCQFDRRLVVITNVFISCFGYNTLLLSNDKCVVPLTRLIVPSVPEKVFETLVAGSTWMGCGTVL